MIPREDAAVLTPWAFKAKYMLPNQPVVVRGLRMMRAAKQWVTSGGEPAWATIKAHFPATEITATDVRSTNKKRDMLLTEYLDWWERHHMEMKSGDAPLECLYCKDWTLAADQPDYTAYQVPQHFEEDWLNLHWERNRADADETKQDDIEGELPACKGSGGDHRFVYMGPKGSWTPLHADVLNSFSWSVNVCGRKRWLLFPPEQTELLKDADGRMSLKDARLAGHRVAGEGGCGDGDVDRIRYPRIAESTPYEVIQGPDETIFVPSGWYHQVHNMEATISINHNWLNGSNIQWGWIRMTEKLAEIKAGLSDPDDLEDDVLLEQLLERKAGMTLNEFARLVKDGALHEVSRFFAAQAAKPCTSENEPREQNLKCQVLHEMISRSLGLMRDMEAANPGLMWDEHLQWKEAVETVRTCLETDTQHAAEGEQKDPKRRRD